MKPDSGGALFRFAVSVLVLGVTASFAPDAAASKTFPGRIQSTLDVPCAPPCTLCHLTTNGGPGQIDETKHFVDGILGAGAVVGNADSIPGALTSMAKECTTPAGFSNTPCDSDGDGMGDTAELHEGRDPNVNGVGNLCGGPTYGCGARVARGTADFDWVALVIAGAAAAALIVSSRRSRPSG